MGKHRIPLPLLGKCLCWLELEVLEEHWLLVQKAEGQELLFSTAILRAMTLAQAVSGEALPYECLDTFRAENGMNLANSSAVGMQPNCDQSPVSKEALESYQLVFDAVYTPRNTRLLQEAAKVGAVVVSGVEMFVRQALGQFKLFTGGLDIPLHHLMNSLTSRKLRVFVWILSRFYMIHGLLTSVISLFCSTRRFHAPYCLITTILIGQGNNHSLTKKTKKGNKY